ncbi:MAG: hypothetical protein WD906_03175 [Anaerolineales bacterium]
MDWTMIVLRILHILGGVFWAGTAFLLVTAIEPTIRDLGAEGGKFMQRLADKGKISARTSAAAGITIVTGLWMYWRVSGDFSAAWMVSGRGLALTIGGVFALVAFGVGYGVTGRASIKMADLGKLMQASGKPPTPEQLAQVKGLQERISAGGRATAILLAITIVGMSSAQYLLF